MLRDDLRRPRALPRQYWSEIPGVYFTGDGARRDEDGYFWIMGRVDDVLNVAGHRLSTDGDRERAGQPPQRRRGRRGRASPTS